MKKDKAVSGVNLIQTEFENLSLDSEGVDDMKLFFKKMYDGLAKVNDVISTYVPVERRITNLKLFGKKAPTIVKCSAEKFQEAAKSGSQEELLQNIDKQLSSSMENTTGI